MHRSGERYHSNYLLASAAVASTSAVAMASTAAGISSLVRTSATALASTGWIGCISNQSRCCCSNLVVDVVYLHRKIFHAYHGGKTCQ